MIAMTWGTVQVAFEENSHMRESIQGRFFEVNPIPIEHDHGEKLGPFKTTGLVGRYDF